MNIGFKIRIIARFIDFLYFIPLVLIHSNQIKVSQNAALISTILYTSFLILYYPYFHAKSGQSLGKRHMKIKVISVDGSNISNWQAILRSIFDISWSLLWCISFLIAIQKMPTNTYPIVGSYSQLMPAWYEITTILLSIVFIIDVLMMIFSKNKQSLHDLLAGTVVKTVT